MCRFVVILMTLSIAFSPLLAGPVGACEQHACACASMTGPHTAPSGGPVPEGCGCPPTTNDHCCVAEKTVPDQPADWLPLERVHAANPALESGGSATVDMGTANGALNPVYTSRLQRRAPPPLAYLLHQSFLI